MKRAERNALRRQTANANRRRYFERGVDVDVMARHLMRVAYAAAVDGRIRQEMMPHTHTCIDETITATARVIDPAQVLLIGVREVFSGWSHAGPRARATFDLAYHAYGWSTPAAATIECLNSALTNAANAFVARQLPVHRALAVVCKVSGYPRLSMRQMKCLGSVLNHRFLRNHLDRQLVGPEVPSVLEAIATAGLTVTDKIYPELLVPPPEWFDMHEKMGEDAA